MATVSKCPYCGTQVPSSSRKCPLCGAANEMYVDAGAPVRFGPETIDELRAFCRKQGMPLEKMRFFISEDYRYPKAYGICRQGEYFVVYKNKSDGTRSVRYNGPDEAFAVRELFTKLLDECHKRGIYPENAL